MNYINFLFWQLAQWILRRSIIARYSVIRRKVNTVATTPWHVRVISLCTTIIYREWTVARWLRQGRFQRILAARVILEEDSLSSRNFASQQLSPSEICRSSKDHLYSSLDRPDYLIVRQTGKEESKPVNGNELRQRLWLSWSREAWVMEMYSHVLRII